jgi:superfamily II DNA/RNA helicase
MTRGTINLSHIEVLVLDEADQMFDMGFSGYQKDCETSSREAPDNAVFRHDAC